MEKIFLKDKIGRYSILSIVCSFLPHADAQSIIISSLNKVNQDFLVYRLFSGGGFMSLEDFKCSVPVLVNLVQDKYLPSLFSFVLNKYGIAEAKGLLKRGFPISQISLGTDALDEVLNSDINSDTTTQQLEFLSSIEFPVDEQHREYVKFYYDNYPDKYQKIVQYIPRLKIEN